MSNSRTHDSKISVINRPGGTVAYEVAGNGPLIVCVPGMGDLRSSYRFVAPVLVTAGYRVALMDLRGHGDSSATFDEYGDEATGGDMTALIEKLGGPAIIIGNSLAAGSAVIVAAARPDLVAGLVLVGPFIRPATVSAVQRLAFRVMMAPLWARTSWNAYLPKLYAGRKPDDFTEYRAAMSAALKKAGHTKAFSLTTHTSHHAAAAALRLGHRSDPGDHGRRRPGLPRPRRRGPVDRRPAERHRSHGARVRPLPAGPAPRSGRSGRRSIRPRRSSACLEPD